MIIDDKIVQAFLKCETKSFLKSLGVIGSPNEFGDWQEHIAEDFRKACSIELCSNLREGEYLSGVSFSQVCENAPCRFVIDCFAPGEGYESRVHALEWIPSPDQENDGLYIPIRFVPSEKITGDDKLLLSFDALAVSADSRLPQYGKIIHGRSKKTLKVHIPGLVPSVRRALEGIATQQASQAPPRLILNRHCSECEFQLRCHQVALEKDELSLLASITEAEQKKHHSKGIFTVTQLSYTFRARRRPKRFALKPEKYSHALKALAIREQKTYVAGKPKLNLTGTRVFLDVEGIPDRGVYYLIGLRVRIGDSYTQYSLWADKEDDEKEIWSSLIQILAEIENPQIVHYGSYEKTFLKKMERRYPEASKDLAIIDDLIANSVNLLSIIYAQIYFPAYSNSLKEIMKTLGFCWTESQASGLSALVWRSKWESSKDSELKQKLITYNAEDCTALEMLTGTVSGLCQKSIEEEIQTNSKIVHTDSMRPELPYRFGKSNFALPELQLINRSAYWDYQRDKVYVRSSQKLRTAVKRNNRGQRNIFTIDQVLKDSSPSHCPRCATTDFRRHDARSRVIWDIRFEEFGIRRWIVKHVFERYFCYQCKKTFDSRPKPWTRFKYGWQLAAYATYQMIDLQIPQNSVTRDLNEMFHFNLNPSEINSLKSAVAQRYKDSYDLMLRKIVNGKLIHVDETWISTQGERGYVWVLTNFEEVVYFYAETREGEKIQGLLKEFKGVLVSDFYGVYDSINCPQQKCLIHLIRDLNEDIHKHPFDTELRALAQTFAALLKPIIGTIDRFGLKAYFLREHKASVEHFYDELSTRDYDSEAATKYKKRFDKNRYKLFTFLDYDDVPWNNNNAEFAIKTFARLRRVIGGLSSVHGIQDYLTLLSICTTCRYKKVGFLDFLRSGEKDIDSFIEKNNHELENIPSRDVCIQSENSLLHNLAMPTSIKR